jgi:hypothetical protein
MSPHVRLYTGEDTHMMTGLPRLPRLTPEGHLHPPSKGCAATNKTRRKKGKQEEEDCCPPCADWDGNNEQGKKWNDKKIRDFYAAVPFQKQYPIPIGRSSYPGEKLDAHPNSPWTHAHPHNMHTQL